MKILSHRGYWQTAAQKNTREAFVRSFALGFGTETDLRDRARTLVVAHDPPDQSAIAATELFAQHAAHDPGLPLALNVKADGLQEMLVQALAQHRPRDAFVFDMSIPDMLHWLARGVPVFVRHSDIEPEPVLYDRAAGVWLDAFHGDWWNLDVVRRHVDAGKRVCIVSPELHRRDRHAVWDLLQVESVRATDRILLCTDCPEAAREAFGDDR